MLLSTLAIKKDAPYNYGMTTRTASLIRAQEVYEAKTSKLNLRLKTKERDALEAAAIAAGITPTRLIRDWIASLPKSRDA